MLSACANWKQKEFEKELSKPADEVAVVVQPSPKEEKLLEKFEVQPVEESKKKPASSSPKVEVKKENHKTAVKVTKKGSETVTQVVKVKAPPKDYPKEFYEINEKARKVWDLYRPNHFINQKVFLDITYLGMTVGKIMIQNQGKKMINDKEVWHFHARFKSAPFYSNIYELDDTVDTYVTTDKFLATRYSLVQRESKQDVDDLQLHDRDQFKTFWFYHQKKSNGSVKDKKLEGFIPYFSTDPFSVLFLYQGLPLANNDVYEIPLINKGKILMLKSVVEGREVVETKKGKKKAIRVHATTKYSGETLKSGDLTFWFTDDAERLLIKAKAKIKIGAVVAELVEK
jgi:hypothetical protein